MHVLRSVPGSMSHVMPGADAGLRTGHLLARRFRLEPRDARAGPGDSEVHKVVLATKGTRSTECFCCPPIESSFNLCLLCFLWQKKYDSLRLRSALLLDLRPGGDLCGVVDRDGAQCRS